MHKPKHGRIKLKALSNFIGQIDKVNAKKSKGRPSIDKATEGFQKIQDGRGVTFSFEVHNYTDFVYLCLLKSYRHIRNGYIF